MLRWGLPHGVGKYTSSSAGADVRIYVGTLPSHRI
jgi:hypothetical protein